MGQIPQTIEIDGQSVLHWLKLAGYEAASEILVGCEIDNQIDDTLLMVESVDVDNVLVCRLGSTNKRVPPAMLIKSTVFDNRPGHPLRAAVNSIKSSADIKLEQAQTQLRAFGMPPEKITRSDDVFVLITAIDNQRVHKLPSLADQNKIYDVLKRSNLLRLGSAIIRDWLDTSLRDHKLVDAGILIKLTYCLRHSGDIEGALRMTEPVVRRFPNISLSSGQRAILATVRTAILLDLWEARRDPNLLIEARRYADVAWAISQSEEISMVYKRLEKLEGVVNV